MKDKVILIIAIVIGIFAFVLTNQYLRSERARLYAGAQKIKVLIAGEELPAGTILEFKDLAQKSVYKSAVGENVFRPQDLDRVIGKKLRYSLKRAEPLWWSYVEMPARGRGGLAPAINTGMRAISLSVSGDAAVSSLVQPNDRVDIIGTLTMESPDSPGVMEMVTLTILQDVTILATGQELAKQEIVGDPGYTPRRTRSYNTVTLEVTPREAELLIFAQHVKGQLALSLRRPDDITFEKDLPNINFEHLEKKLPELNEYRQKYIRLKTDF